MMDMNILKKGPPEASYEELSVLSLDAAIELDRYQRGEEIDAAAIDKLADRLGIRREDFSNADALRRVVDPKTVDIYSRTVSQLTTTTVSTIDELATQIRDYTDAFKRGISSIGEDDIKNMRDFCLALHTELLAEIYDRRVDTSLKIA